MTRPPWLTDELIAKVQEMRAAFPDLGRHRVQAALGVTDWKAATLLRYVRANCPVPEPVDQPSQDIGAALLAGQVQRIRSREAALEARERTYFDLLAGAVRAFPAYSPQRMRRDNGNTGEETAVLLLSDWHTGEIVRAEEVAGINSYSTEILARRLELLSEKVSSLIALHRKYARIDNLVVAVLGDMTCGTIHADLEKSADLVAVEQPAMAGWLLACVIAEMAREFRSVEVVTVVGNHGRLTKKPEFKHAFNSYDFQAYQIAALYLQRIANVSFDVGRGLFLTRDIQGWRFMFTHGHTVRGWAGIPYYGFQREFQAAQKRNQLSESAGGDLRQPVKPVHYLCAGHYHQLGEIDNGIGATMLNGSTKGTDEFGYALPGGKIGRPNQRVFGVHPEYGVTFDYPVWLDSAAPKHPGRFADRLPDCWAQLQAG